MSQIIIPTPLRKFTNETASYASNGQTVKEAINELISTFKGLERYLLDEEGKFRSYIRIYVGEEDIDSLQKGQTAIQNDTVISIVPAIAGG